MSDPSFLHDYIAGAIGGCAGLVVGHPFDTTKVQLQVQAAQNRYAGTWDCIKNVQKQGMARGFFRGMSWPLFSYGAVNSLFFGVYGNSLNFIRRHSGSNKEDKARYWETYLAGCIGGVAQLVIACPIDLVKVVLQSQIPHGAQGEVPKSASLLHVNGRPSTSLYYRGPWTCAVDVVRTRGALSLYRGMLAMAYRDVPTFGVYTLLYDITFRFLSRSEWLDRHGVVASLIAGGIAGIFTWLPVIPFDVAKSRLQADVHNRQYTGLFDCFLKNYQREGVQGLFRGGLLICVRAFIANAAIFLFYSQTLKNLAHLSQS